MASRPVSGPALLVLLALHACNSPSSRPAAQGGAGGQEEMETGGAGGTMTPTGGTGGGAGGAAPDAGASGGTSGSAPDAAGESRDAAAEKPVTAADTGASADGYPESDHLPGRPDIRLCKKEWNREQCCALLCSCLNTICSDSPKAKPGLADCMTWCPKISDMAARCHVYHCYISISPTGGIRDHDSHCGHAAHQVPGGSCPAVVYQ